MKKLHVSIMILTAIVLSTLAFKGREAGTISGKVSPADGASNVWAMQGTDTLKTPIADGTFSFPNAKTGIYTVIVDAKQPFQDVTITNVKVEDGKVTDLGEIKLSEQ